MINEGSLLNKGFEFSLNADIIRSNGWKWNVGGNIGFNKTTIENLGLEVSGYRFLERSTWLFR